MTDTTMAATPTSALLDRIDNPEALRRLDASLLPQLAHELRAYLVESIARCGGHLAAGLGTVELAVALHHVFDTPQDAIVWDVGHQAYPHKALTGRRRQLAGIRRRGGLSGFLRREESPFDVFGAGHSSTSISAALGLAISHAQQRIDRRAVAVIGDGAMTAGLAFEALDHAGALDVDLLVVLNDNRMSISPNVGALNQYLARCATLGGKRASSRRRDALRALAALWRPDAAGDDTEEQHRRPGELFEALGFAYFGPLDGHDVCGLARTLRTLKSMRGPRLLHVLTRKGCGYAPAEADPVKYHGVTPFDPRRGIAAGSAAEPTFTQVFGDWLCDLAARDPRTIAITPAMREGSGLVRFAKLFPDRYFDVGIAEQHAVTLAAGLAAGGLRPVVAIYSTFLQRAYDQLIHDVALQRLPVLFAVDRAGLVGPDGATHNGAFDLTFLRCVPNLILMTPADGGELRHMLHTGMQQQCPVAVRYPRASAAPCDVEEPLRTLAVGVAELRRNGRRVALLAFGTLLRAALDVAEVIDASVVNMRFVKPLDTRTVLAMARSHELIVTLEENAVAGGAGSAVVECLAAHGVHVDTLHLGLPDRYIEHGTRDEALADVGLDPTSILEAITEKLAQNGPVPGHFESVSRARTLRGPAVN